MADQNPLDSEGEISESLPEVYQIDPFLFTALSNPRDRLTILKLDNDLDKFMKDATRSRCEVPSLSSYQSLIVHRVADYFKLNHVAGNGKRSVVLFKTPESRLPVIRFTDLVEETPDVSPAAVKIMRRSSAAPSSFGTPHSNSHQPNYTIQPPSSSHPHSGHPQQFYSSMPGNLDWRRSRSDDAIVTSHQYDGKAEKADRTLEEREAQYAQVRARIFGSSELQSSPEGSLSNGIPSSTNPNEDVSTSNSNRPHKSVSWSASSSQTSPIPNLSTLNLNDNGLWTPPSSQDPTAPGNYGNPTSPDNNAYYPEYDFPDVYRQPYPKSMWDYNLIYPTAFPQVPANSQSSQVSHNSQNSQGPKKATSPSGKVNMDAKNENPRHVISPPHIPMGNPSFPNSTSTSTRPPPPLIYQFPNEDMWSFYGGGYPVPFPMGNFGEVPGMYYYDIDRRPPKSVELFDPNAPIDKNTRSQPYPRYSLGVLEETRNPRNSSQSFQRSPSYDSFFLAQQQQQQMMMMNQRNQAEGGTLRTPHILEIHAEGGATDDVLSEISNSGLAQGATIKSISDKVAVIIYKTSQAAQEALSASNSSPEKGFTLSP